MDFLTEYLDWVGETEYPQEYFLWSMVSVVAACLTNRVWVTNHVQRKLHPNLYTMLIGPSMDGKSLALSTALSLLRKSSYASVLNLFEGHTTAPAMYDSMLVTKKTPVANRLYLVHDELANDVGDREQAGALVRSLTRMYYGEPFTDRTRYNFRVELSNYTTNWIACSTYDWLRDSFPENVVQVGFTRRVIAIQRGYTGRRFYSRTARSDSVEESLVEQIEGFLHLDGEFHRTPEALDAVMEWYMGRDRPVEGTTFSEDWLGEPEMLDKLSLIAAIVDGSDHVITLEHHRRGLALLASVKKVPVDWNFHHHNAASSKLHDEVLKTIQVSRMVKHSALLRQVYHMGVNARALRDVVDTLRDAGVVKVHVRPPKLGGTAYEWIGEKV